MMNHYNKNMKNVLIISTAIAGASLSSLFIRKLAKPSIETWTKKKIIQMLKYSNIEIDQDIIVYDDSIYLEWMNHGILAIGETYMAKKWDVKNTTLDNILTRLMKLPSDKKKKLFKSWNAQFIGLIAHIFNYQSPERAGMVGAYHYDLGNDFFSLWLDKNLQYSCGYWKTAKDLENAQLNKLHMIAKKLLLKSNMKVLEIGCGWGGLACFLAKEYNVHVTGITISNEQLKGARERAVRMNVTDKTSFLYCDYRKMEGQFDRVVSIAMLEAVGYKNLDDYYKIINNTLKDDGIALVHSICSNKSRKVPNQRWILKYIFPNGFLPSVTQMCQFVENKDLIVEDVHNFGPDYDKTLMAWQNNFTEHVNNGNIKKSQVFIRMWNYYLCYCAAGFRARTIQLNQVVYSKKRYERYDTNR